MTWLLVSLYRIVFSHSAKEDVLAPGSQDDIKLFTQYLRYDEDDDDDNDNDDDGDEDHDDDAVPQGHPGRGAGEAGRGHEPLRYRGQCGLA